MAAFVDLSGKQIGLWKVLHRCDPPEGRQGVWFLCECQCENKTTKPVQAGNLSLYKKSAPKGSGSCGCVGAKKTGDRRRKHGQSGNNRTPTYTAWRSMLRRCYDKSDKSYSDYGGREPNPRTVCERWKTFEHFFADMGEKPEDTELDRINNEDSYTCGKPECPECGPVGKPCNCRWVTRADNLRNREEVKKFLYQGELLTCGQIVERSGINLTAVGLKDRIERLGLTVDQALAMPVKERKMTHTYQGEEWTTTELEALCGILAVQIGKRINQYGWTVERAISEPVNDGMGVPKTIQWEGREWTIPELSAHCGVPSKRLYARVFLYHWPIEQAVQDKDFRKE